MKITATRCLAKDLKPGDLFSSIGQVYWDNIKNNHSLGEKVYIRTLEPAEDDLTEVYRITIEV